MRLKLIWLIDLKLLIISLYWKLMHFDMILIGHWGFCFVILCMFLILILIIWLLRLYFIFILTFHPFPFIVWRNNSCILLIFFYFSMDMFLGLIIFSFCLLFDLILYRNLILFKFLLFFIDFIFKWLFFWLDDFLFLHIGEMFDMNLGL